MLGIGNVGVGTYKIFQMNKKHIEDVTGTTIEFAKILARDLTKDRGVEIPTGVMTSNPDDILNNDDIDIVVELLGGIEPATTFMLTALNNGKHVVTANKAAIAANYGKFMEAAKRNNVKFMFEASVCGAIPVLSSISNPLCANRFSEVMGIVNGTTNYILTQMHEFGYEYEDVLKKAQELGFAEADPTADVEGYDVANKLSVLIALMFGVHILPKDIPTKGISHITKADIDAAKKDGCKIKLVAHAKMADNGLEYKVEPISLPPTHPLAAVNNEFNAVFITGNASDELVFYGRGAGSIPTGSAVAGDIVTIIKNI